MNDFTVWAIASPLNAFICCSFITFFLKNLHLKNHIRMGLTYFVYILLSFVTCAGGNGLFNLDMENFQLMRFLLFTASGFCVCLGIYFFFERGNISEKIRQRQAQKKGK